MERVRPVSITHRDHYVNIARRRATEFTELALKQREAKSSLHVNGHVLGKEEQASNSAIDCQGGFFADQFENLANFNAHFEGTGPEIWEQTAGKLHAFIAAAGTGGTLAGVSRFLQVHSLPFSCIYFQLPLCCGAIYVANLHLRHKKKIEKSYFCMNRIICGHQNRNSAQCQNESYLDSGL